MWAQAGEGLPFPPLAPEAVCSSSPFFLVLAQYLLHETGPSEGSYLLGFLMLLKVDKAKTPGVAAVIPHHLHTQHLPWEGPTWLKGKFGNPPRWSPPFPRVFRKSKAPPPGQRDQEVEELVTPNSLGNHAHQTERRVPAGPARPHPLGSSSRRCW